jgi:CubicO group peptidase (beta-lactamase class C family)
LTLHNPRAIAQETQVRGCRLCHRLPLYRLVELCYNPDIEHTKPLSEGSSSLNTGARSSVPFPAPAYARQDAVFARAFDVLRRAMAEHAFPAASVAITWNGNLVCLKPLGRFTYEPDSPEVTTASIFDLASVSKVAATTTMAMILYERGLLDLEMPVAAVVPEFAGDDAHRGEVTLHMLLAHSSGLPAYEKLFLRAKTREEFLAAAFATPLVADPGTRTDYSDIGFITLGVALERIADETLDRFCQREVFGPLGMTHTAFNPPAAWRSSIPPTVDDRTFRHRIIQGEVQDENASVLGGVAGHAGLFASAENVAILAHAMLKGGRPILRPETLARFTRREAGPEATSRALG